MSNYTKLPSKAQVKLTPFEARVSEEKLSEFKQLIKLCPIGPAVYENQQQDRKWGMPRQWLVDAKEQWATKFDWRAHEKRINSFPNYTVPIKDDDGHEYTMHFVGLFSDKEEAIPIAFYHGWPGSFLEFLDLLDVIKSKYTAAELPYHVIVPSLPGYGYSSGPPIDKDATIPDMPRVCNKLMESLGFGSGYIAQGGDLGSFVSRQSAERFDACKAFHLNMAMVPTPSNADQLQVEEIEKKARGRGEAWLDTGTAYGQEHGTRTATIGLVLSSSPIAMLAWIGEKFLEWTDTDPPVEQILESVSLYWLTDTFSRCIYPYRSLYGPDRKKIQAEMKPTGKNTKPMGFSWFPKELVPTPISWVATTGNLVHYNRHETGGHFAAMENPKVLWSDVEEFVKVAWSRPRENL